MTFWCHRFDQKNNERTSALAPKTRSKQKSSARESKWNPIISGIKCPYFFRNPFVVFLVKTMTPKGHFEINWPLTCTDRCFDMIQCSILLYNCIDPNHLWLTTPLSKVQFIVHTGIYKTIVLKILQVSRIMSLTFEPQTNT